MEFDSRKQDKFVAMATAKAEVDLKLSDFAPRSMLVTPVHSVERAAVPAIDYHNHLDAFEPRGVLRVMDACNIERVVNITMRTGKEAVEVIERYGAFPDRFSVMGWMDWSDVKKPDFFQKSVARLEQLADLGVCGIKFWKDLGLSVRDASGELLRIDDERLAPIFDKAAEIGIPVMFHTADPDAFFLPIDRRNERYEELAAHPDWGFSGSHFSKDDLLDQRNRVFARHPGTSFVAAHLAERGENLAYVADMLDKYPNVSVDMSARVAELGRQPYTARRFFLRYQDRILFGTDLFPEIDTYRLHFRFFETEDEYFDYPSHASRQGRWKICGINLPTDVLQKIYRENSLRLLPA
ncbi:MAG: amidohydrolase family protein [Acidobacteriaceae bacterium]